MDQGMETVKSTLTDIIGDARDIVDGTIYSPEAAAIGAGLIAAASIGYILRHPEMALFLAAETGDVAQELMSEIGGLTSAVEVGGD